MKELIQMAHWELLRKIDQDPRGFLEAIHNDPMLRRRQHPHVPELFIANASKTFFEPKEVHQLAAKGIVYDAERWKVVSMPLVKMYNYGLSAHTTEVAHTLLRDVARGAMSCVAATKEDGTLIQVFHHKGQRFITTRSVLEGTEREEQDEERFIKEAREMLADVVMHEDITYLFEMVSPNTRVVTRYSGEDDHRLYLLSIWSREANWFWPPNEVKDEALRLQARGCFAVRAVRGQKIQNKEELEQLMARLEVDPRRPEGVVLTFFDEDSIIWRCKVKTKAYLAAHRLRFECSYARTVELIKSLGASMEELMALSWDTFRDHLRATLPDLDEELERGYSEHFSMFCRWRYDIGSAHRIVLLAHQDGLEAAAAAESEKERRKRYVMAVKHLLDTPDTALMFGLAMMAYDGTFNKDELLRAMPPERFKEWE